MAELSKKRSTPIMLFYDKNFSVICFRVLNTIVSLYFTQILSKTTFMKRATPPMLMKKVYINRLYGWNTIISQALVQIFKYWINFLIFDWVLGLGG